MALKPCFGKLRAYSRGERAVAATGLHCILELYRCPLELLNDAAFVKEALREAVKRASSTLIEEVVHQFRPQGVTAIALLAESHISIHTWPELAYAAADVFTCGSRVRPEEACRYLASAFMAREHSLIKLPRGARPAPGARPSSRSKKEEVRCPVPKSAPIAG
ncbi:MAG: adenosylmethionine decarboxylase [Planctomycetes bacterium]|nr:adenosylmethionine decarboxylase [Planctomycetota bacterium]